MSPSLPPNADELVSAYIDGEAAADEIALIEASPELLAQVEAMRRVSAELGAVATPPPAQKEAHISAALDAFDAMFASDTADSSGDNATASDGRHLAAVASSPSLVHDRNPELTTGAPAAEPAQTTNVASLGQARERRRRRFSPGLIAAAVAALTLIVLAGVFGLGGRSNDTASTALLEVESDVAASSDSAAADSAAERAEEPAADSVASADEETTEDAMADEESADAADSANADEFLAEAAEPPAAAQSAPSATAGPSSSDDGAAEAVESSDGTAGLSPRADGTDGLSRADGVFYGEFDTIDQLLTELLPNGDRDRLSLPEGEPIATSPDVGPSCQAHVPNLFASELATFAGIAVVDGTEIEIHVLVEDEFSSLYLVQSEIDNANSCQVLDIIQTQDF